MSDLTDRYLRMIAVERAMKNRTSARRALLLIGAVAERSEWLFEDLLECGSVAEAQRILDLVRDQICNQIPQRRRMHSDLRKKIRTAAAALQQWGENVRHSAISVDDAIRLGGVDLRIMVVELFDEIVDGFGADWENESARIDRLEQEIAQSEQNSSMSRVVLHFESDDGKLSTQWWEPPLAGYRKPFGRAQRNRTKESAVA